jgi:hypothetical protein
MYLYMYYLKKDYKLVGYEKSHRKGKMYNAILKNKKKIVKVPFGDDSMGNFNDKTGLNLYPNLIHGDKKRRLRFQQRHHGFLKDDYYSPSWFSYYVLW